jgi:hypothetical protein
MRSIGALLLLVVATGCGGPAAPTPDARPECLRQLGHTSGGGAAIFLTAAGICPEGGWVTLATEPVQFQNLDARPHRLAAFKYPDPTVPDPVCAGYGVGLLGPGESRAGIVRTQCVQCTVHDALDPTNRAYWVSIRTAPC